MAIRPETQQKYFAFLKDCFVTKKFTGREICKVHAVNTNAVAVLAKLGMVEKLPGRGGYKWIKPEPSEKTAAIVLEALNTYMNGGEVTKQIAGTQDTVIKEKKLLNISEAISTLKAAGYKIMKPVTDFVEV